MAVATKMTQSAIVKELADTTEIPTKTAKHFMTVFAEMAVRNQEERHVRDSWNRTPGTCGPQGAHRPQSRDRARDQNSSQESSKVPRGESGKRRDRSAQKEVGCGFACPVGCDNGAGESAAQQKQTPREATLAGFVFFKVEYGAVQIANGPGSLCLLLFPSTCSSFSKHL